MSQTSLQDHLQHEFCPPLEPTLLAAILSDYPNDITNDSQEYLVLRDMLRCLADQASLQLLQEHLQEDSEAISESESQSLNESHRAPRITSVTTPSTSSFHSWMPPPEFNEAMSFLQTAFPRLPSSQIGRTIREVENFETREENRQIDMDQVVAALLSQEYILQMEERGLDSSEDLARIPHSSWSERPKSSKTRTRTFKGQTRLLNDIRQQHQISTPSKPKGKNALAASDSAAIDPWTQTASLCTFVASVTRNSSVSHFQSYMHDPTYKSPASAVRASLTTLQDQHQRHNQTAMPESQEAILVNMLDILHSTRELYDDLTLEERDAVISDARVALDVCNTPDDALLLVDRLRELDADKDRGMTQGLYHSDTRPLIQATSGRVQPDKDSQGIRSQATAQPPQSGSTKPSASKKPSSGEWVTVIAKSRNTRGKGKIRDAAPEDATGIYRQRQLQALDRRSELLFQASHYWRQGHKVGGSRSLGGGVALFYAERARKLAEESKDWALKSALASVEAKRNATPNSRIDLHGLTVDEALHVVRAILAEGDVGCSPDRPLEIITGMGKHSHNRIGVLAPAVRQMLVDEGWNYSKFDAGLIVRGRL